LDYRDNTEVVVFLNGLADSIESWAPVKSYLSDNQSTLFIDLIGQGKSLDEEIAASNGKELDFVISVDEQAQAVKEVWDSLKIKTKFHLLGFSYGGGVAIRTATLFPDLIDKLILFLPYIIRLDLAFPIQRIWAGQMGFLKNLNMFKPQMSVLGDGYKKMIRDYMNFRFSKHIPDNNIRRVSMDLTEGIMPFNAFEYFDLLPDHSVHLITVEHDTLVPKSLYYEIWTRLPDSKKSSWLNIKDGEHLIFEQAPLYCAQWIEKILKFKKQSSPRTFEGNSYRMETREKPENAPYPPFSPHSKIS
tara:strand:+ start:27500 stop:28405 length:906 start_codon:yes stop_codon:yes gene_type:complete